MDISDARISPRYTEDPRNISGRVAVNERCPKCYSLGQGHLIIDHRQMACIKCRTVFVTEAYMNAVVENMDAVLASGDAEYTDEDIRELAKFHRIPSWHLKKIETLRKDLGMSDATG